MSATVAIEAVEHVRVGDRRDLVCHWPRQRGPGQWGEEMLLACIESPCTYTDPLEVSHGRPGIW